MTSETLVNIDQTTQRNNPEDGNLHTHRCENLKSYILWKDFGNFQPKDVHKQVAITFRTPRYKSLEVEAPVAVNIRLFHPSDKATSEPLPFDYLPLDSGRPAFSALGIKGNYSMFPSILASNTALLTGGRPRNVADITSSSSVRMIRPEQPISEASDVVELTKPVEHKIVVPPPSIDGASTSGVAQGLGSKPATIENEICNIKGNTTTNNNVMMTAITDMKDTRSSSYNYTTISKRNKAASGEMDTNANIQNEGERKNDILASSDDDVIFQGETS
ncbi:transcription factor p65-like [Zootermopsis nevadensis]|uniref:transcription factor p65-like n=1 Tax=Zootermopsis nevadensis TaxID=136037 RepID=UPI000B8E69B7|nr:transcription factor p65-like [Zootermopsis nevadensis]